MLGIGSGFVDVIAVKSFCWTGVGGDGSGGGGCVVMTWFLRFCFFFFFFLGCFLIGSDVISLALRLDGKFGRVGGISAPRVFLFDDLVDPQAFLVGGRVGAD